MHGRGFIMKYLLWILCTLRLLLCTDAHSGTKPNFVFMMVDDLGIGDLGCYGNTTLRTPNIDRLAMEGVKLTQHIAAAPLCTPSRAAFLTGRYPIRSGMAAKGRMGVFLFTASSGGLPQEEITFAKAAKGQGYSTAVIGKWHLGLNCEDSADHCHHPNSHGFDYFYGTIMTHLRDCQPGHGSVLHHIHAHIPYKALGVGLVSLVLLHIRGTITVTRKVVFVFLVLVGVFVSLFGVLFYTFPNLNCFVMRGAEIVEQPYTSENLTQRMTSEAIEYLERNSQSPFLLFFSFIQVHTGLFASPLFRGKSQHGLYGDAVMEIDWSVGQIIKTLERLNLKQNTLVYMTSDQGPHLEEISIHGEMHGGYSSIYKAGKSTNWEGGIRIPGILRWPGVLPAGKVIDEPTSNMDIFPTVLNLAGASIPSDRIIDGHDLLPLLQGQVERSEHEFMFHYCNAELNAVRWHPPNSSAIWKAFFFTPDFYPKNSSACFHTHICFCIKPFTTFHDPPLLYDLSRDPSESTPLSPDTEPQFYSVLMVIRAAVSNHTQSLKPVPIQLSPLQIVWKPWLQPCCSSLSQLCRCERDHQIEKLRH
ncbi:steryl-sulfatase isoform X1 [Siphateles boraxobius]|uniref:steryl-sulfatase isoform X1 n=2 Tax=Siphateles boraxobius TaxID=180520 RepID=UPI004062D251